MINWHVGVEERGRNRERNGKTDREGTVGGLHGRRGQRKVAKEREVRNDGGRKRMACVAVTTTSLTLHLKACIVLSQLL